MKTRLQLTYTSFLWFGWKQSLNINFNVFPTSLFTPTYGESDKKAELRICHHNLHAKYHLQLNAAFVHMIKNNPHFSCLFTMFMEANSKTFGDGKGYRS